MKFYSNSGSFEGTTIVRNIVEEDGKYLIDLEDSEFYPESGGQISDTGFIEDIPVIDVIEINSVKYHILKEKPAFNISNAVKYRINIDARMDASIQHTGQHLLSAILEKNYGIKTNSFRMTREYTTIDTDKRVLHEMRDEIEEYIMDAIGEAVPVSSQTIKSEDIDRYSLRKIVEVEGDVQLIKIGDIDYQACCGTHVSNTAELGLFTIKKIEKYKEGSRITFLFGNRALDDYREMRDILEDLKSLLEVHESEIPFTVTLLKERDEENRKTLNVARERLVHFMLISDKYKKDIINEVLDEDEETIKSLNSRLSERGANSILIDRKNLRIYVNISQETGLAAGSLFKELKSADIRGGGGKYSFQAVGENIDSLLLLADKTEEAIRAAL